MMASTNLVISKKKRGIWLVGAEVETITGSKLPSIRQVFGRFFHVHTIQKQTVQASAIATARELESFWGKARIPIRLECHVVQRIKELHSTWQGLRKSASRRTQTQLAKEGMFVSKLDDLFDVAHTDALN